MNESTFHYDGYLVFTPVLIRTKNIPATNIPNIDEIISQLPEFHSGDPSAPAEGFEEMKIRKYIENDNKLSGAIKRELKDLTAVTYNVESYHEETAFVDQERREVYVREVESAEVYFFDSNIALLRGKQSIVNQAISAIQRVHSEEILIENIEFTPDFMSHIYEEFNDVFSDNIIQPNEISEVQFEGFDNISTMKIYSGDLKSELTNRYQNMSEGQINYITVKYYIDNIDTAIQIQSDRLHVKASEGAISRMTDLARMIYSIYFCKRISNIAVEYEGVQTR
ncbi:hypothetical protein [Haloarcula brevis]|uniref:hypothetical protein n=1 Tax=Haloarcula brevis TaxID=3111453 RepID=UPI00300E941A